MLKVYKPIPHDIYKAHNLIEYLVNEVWCEADKTPVENKLNETLSTFYNNARLKNFKKDVEEIYDVCKSLDNNEKLAFKHAFENNNKIEEICDGSRTPIDLSTLNKKLIDKIEPFFKELYTSFLGWKDVCEYSGDKKEYYDELNLKNGFNECPCCGYGDIKTFNSKGRSPYDHYLPQKHYPFAATNFNNLVPICADCNSDEKGETDILKYGTPIYYPCAKNHPKIEVKVEVDKKALKKLIEPTDTLKDKVNKKEIMVSFNLTDNKTKVWDKIFDIKSRYFSKIADNRVSWIDDVRQVYRNGNIKTNTVSDAFNMVVSLDSHKQLGYLKAPYLNSMKSNPALLKAIGEVSGNSRINN